LLLEKIEDLFWDLAASYDIFANFIKEKLKDDFNDYGFGLEPILVENISVLKR